MGFCCLLNIVCYRLYCCYRGGDSWYRLYCWYRVYRLFEPRQVGAYAALALLILCTWAALSQLLHYFITTHSLLFHYSFTTPSLLFRYYSTFAHPSLNLRPTFAHPSLILRPHLLVVVLHTYKKRRPRVAYPQIEAFALPF